MARAAHHPFPVAASLLLVALAGCGDSSGPQASYVGAWTGSTSQGRILHFYAEPSGIVLVAVGFEVVGTLCTENIIVFLEREPPGTPFTVTSTGLTIQTSGSGGSITITGTFDSPAQVSGTLVVNSSGCGGNISETWTATRAGSPAMNLTGVWDGLIRSSQAPALAAVTITLTQSGAALSGTYTSANGGSGTVSGTVSGKAAKFTLTQTTAGCPGSFTGHGILVESPEFMQFFFRGSDCLGEHTDGFGSVDRNP